MAENNTRPDGAGSNNSGDEDVKGTARDPFVEAQDRIAQAAQRGMADLPEIPKDLKEPVKYPTTNVTRWKKGDDKPQMGGEMMRAMSIGMQFAFGVGGMAGIGWAVQHFFFPNAAPWVLLGAAALGLVGAMYNFIREANKTNR